MSVEVDVYSGTGFIGANLTWNVVFSLNSYRYWDVSFMPNGDNESLTILSKSIYREANGNSSMFVNYRNNAPNDTYFSYYLVGTPSL
jgi:hypothetical protein